MPLGLGQESPRSARGKMFFPPSRLDTLQSSEPDPPIIHVSSNEVGPKATRAVQEAATAVVGSGQRFLVVIRWTGDAERQLHPRGAGGGVLNVFSAESEVIPIIGCDRASERSIQKGYVVVFAAQFLFDEHPPAGL